MRGSDDPLERQKKIEGRCGRCVHFALCGGGFRTRAAFANGHWYGSDPGCYLTEEEIIEAAKIASRVKPDFVKTSTGFGTAGAKVEHVRLMKQYAGPDVQVKAAGGIRSWEAAKSMIEAGATRLGTSSGVKIVEEMRAAGCKEA